MREYFIEFPFPPSLNTRLAKRFLPKEHRVFHDLAARIACSISEGRPLTGSLEVSYYLQKGDMRSFDIQNFNKILDDGLTAGGLWVDDSLIDLSHQHRLPYVKGQAKLYIWVKEVDPTSGLDKDIARVNLVKQQNKKQTIRRTGK